MACLAARKGNKNDYYQQDQQNQKKEKHRNIKCQDKRLPRVREQKAPAYVIAVIRKRQHMKYIAAYL